MKKVLSVLMVVAAMMFATNANAQIKFGLKGGLDVTNMSLSNDVFDASNKTGFFVGPMVKVTIPIVGLSFDAAALYDQKEAKVSVNDAETTMTQKSLNIPVNVRYGFGLSSLANVFVFAGPQWGINVGVPLCIRLVTVKPLMTNTVSTWSFNKSIFDVFCISKISKKSHSVARVL